jgi:prepilin-type N-terminal cleavage/methylation domain-containing protein
MNKSRLAAAFTLIELLVVISIIAVLAGFAVPAFQGAVMNGRMANASNNARQIGLALRLYANDYDGAYPTKRNIYDEEIVSSNDVFRSLIPAYLDTEKVFTVGGSKAGPTADNQIETKEQMVARGENHWAFVTGLSASSNSNWPLIVDHTNGAGLYNTHEGELGGTWKGLKTVVIAADVSARVVPLLGTGDQRYLPRHDDKTKNALLVTEYMGESAKLLEPAL